MNLEGKSIGFCFTGSFCMFSQTIKYLKELSKINNFKKMLKIILFFYHLSKYKHP